jgi:hypothetical protein
MEYKYKYKYKYGKQISDFWISGPIFSFKKQDPCNPLHRHLVQFLHVIWLNKLTPNKRAVFRITIFPRIVYKLTIKKGSFENFHFFHN